MSQDLASSRRAPLSTLSDYELDIEEEEEAEEEGPDTTLKLLVVDRRGTFSAEIQRVARSLEECTEIVTVSRPTRLLEDVHRESPDVVLAAPEEMTPTGLRRLALIHRASPKTVIALTQGATPISMTEAASCGASEVISYPASTVKLRNALHRILATAEAVRGERVVIREVPAPAPEPAAAQGARTRVRNATIFTVTSPTGGCGKTFFATNLAAYLVGVTGGRVLLVDLDLQFGEVSLALGLRPQRTIAELINEEDMDEALPEYLMEHSSGYHVLSAPADPFAAELVGPREATQVLECAQGQFDYIVVDTPPSLNEVVLAAFDLSRYLVVMATLDVPSLRNLRVFLETIDRLKLPAEDISCVLNKAEPDNGIDLQELLRVYPQGFAAVLPYSREVSRSLNIGQPVLTVDPRAEISQRLLEAGAKLVPASHVTNPLWGARPPGRVSWPGRRRERQAQVATNHMSPPQPVGRPQPATAALQHQTPAAASSGARAPDESMQRETFDAEPYRPAGHASSWTRPQPATAAAAPGPTLTRMPSGLAYQAAAPPRQNENLLTRILLRAGWHSSQRRWDEMPPQPAGSHPSLASQMQVGPVTSPGPLRMPAAPSSGPSRGPGAASSGPMRGPSGTPGPVRGPSAPAGSSPGHPSRNTGPAPEAPTGIAYSGSRRVPLAKQRPQSRRERPKEVPATTWKEPRR